MVLPCFMIHGWTFDTWVLFWDTGGMVYLWIVLFSETVSFLTKGFMVSSGLMQYCILRNQGAEWWRIVYQSTLFKSRMSLLWCNLIFSIILHASYPVEIYCLMEDPRCVSVSYDHPVPATGWPQLWRSTTHWGINRPLVCIPASSH